MSEEIRFKMMGPRMLLKELPKQEKVGNIAIPDFVRLESLIRSEVIAIGPEVENVKVGDVIQHVPDLGAKIFDGKIEYNILPEESAICIDLKPETKVELDEKEQKELEEMIRNGPPRNQGPSNIIPAAGPIPKGIN